MNNRKHSLKLNNSGGALDDLFVGGNMELELYGLFRDYVKHEDNLTNNRLNWNFTIQGFLFAAWVYCVQKYAELSNSIATASSVNPEAKQHLNLIIQDIHWASLVIGGTGLIVSLLVGLGAFGGRLAIQELQAQWEKSRIQPNTASEEPLKHQLELPGLTGGGNDYAHLLGFGAPIAIPVVFVAVWVVRLTWHWR